MASPCHLSTNKFSATLPPSGAGERKRLERRKKRERSMVLMMRGERRLMGYFSGMLMPNNLMRDLMNSPQVNLLSSHFLLLVTLMLFDNKNIINRIHKINYWTNIKLNKQIDNKIGKKHQKGH